MTDAQETKLTNCRFSFSCQRFLYCGINLQSNAVIATLSDVPHKDNQTSS
ncbi:23345_t:CDS:1, partial [Dentiscutata erythropus]